MKNPDENEKSNKSALALGLVYWRLFPVNKNCFLITIRCDFYPMTFELPVSMFITKFGFFLCDISF